MQREYQKLKFLFGDSELKRISLENELRGKQQDHQECQSILDHELFRHHETEKTLEAVWAAHAKLEEVVSDVQFSTEEGTQDGKRYNVAELVLEVAAKSQHTEDLDAQLEKTRRDFYFRMIDFQEKLHSNCQHFSDLDLSHQDGFNKGRKEKHESSENDGGSSQHPAPRLALLPAIKEEELLPVIKEEEA